MLSNLLDFDASDILSIAFGFLLALYGEPVYCWVRNRIDGKARKVKRPKARQVVTALFVLALIVTLYSTHKTNAEMKRLSLETLQTSEAVCEEQKVRKEETTAQTNVFLKSLQVSAQIRDLPLNDPVRIKAGEDLVNEYVSASTNANKRRAELAKEFAEHPRTKPTCIAGK